MTDAMLQKVQDWLRAHEAELLSDTQEILRVPSLESTPAENAPYGVENRAALDWALAKANSWGMATTDLEGHLGFAEFGTGERLVMSLGHLDVVPVSDGWKHQPFGGEVDGEYLYSRGAVDDKGPTIASFYAMRAIKECFPEIPARMRQAFGCNEESGFGCVARYMQTEEAPTFGIAPDSGWPLYNCEKGIANLEIDATIPVADFQLMDVSGGQRPNIVIDQSQATVKVAASCRKEVEEKLADSWDKNVSWTWDGDLLRISALGKASHGSTPHNGDNAALRVFRFILALAPLSVQEFYEHLFELPHIGGVGLGIAGSDEPSGDLTCNMGIVSMSEGKVHMLFNIRYPATWTGAMLQSRCTSHLESFGGGFELTITRDSPPLYFPEDHPLVKTIVEVYHAETGEQKKPGSMGGGTYARAVPNTVSIGTSWLGDGPAHENDERIKIEHLFRSSRIYAHILLRLATM